MQQWIGIHLFVSHTARINHSVEHVASSTARIRHKLSSMLVSPMATPVATTWPRQGSSARTTPCPDAAAPAGPRKARTWTGETLGEIGARSRNSSWTGGTRAPDEASSPWSSARQSLRAANRESNERFQRTISNDPADM